MLEVKRLSEFARHTPDFWNDGSLGGFSDQPSVYPEKVYDGKHDILEKERRIGIDQRYDNPERRRNGEYNKCVPGHFPSEVRGYGDRRDNPRQHRDVPQYLHDLDHFRSRANPRMISEQRPLRRYSQFPAAHSRPERRSSN